MPFVLAMAWRESRSSLRRMALLLASIALGVAALVAISSFTDSLQGSVREQARSLLGADLALGSANRFSPRAEAELEKALREARRLINRGRETRRKGLTAALYCQLAAQDRGGVVVLGDPVVAIPLPDASVDTADAAAQPARAGDALG
jgi:ABC-type lipoprotein release transport system permease subunit